AVPPYDDLGAEASGAVRRATQLLDAVVECARPAVHLVEVPAQIASGPFIGNAEEVFGFRMFELPPHKKRGQRALHGRPAEPPLHRVQPQSRLVISDDTTGAGI